MKVEYYENKGGAAAKLEVAKICGDGELQARFYNNKTLSGTPVVTRCELSNPSYDWGTGRPTAGVSADGFSARWDGFLYFQPGDYTFTVTGDDGVRLWVDDQLLIDQWRDQAPATYTATRTLSEGRHYVKLDYYENAGGAVVRLNWGRGCSVGQYRAEYFNNVDLSGSPVLTRCEAAPLNHDWGTGSPGPGVNADGFSARFTGTIRLPTTTMFYATSDDGMRIWVDGTQIMDQWHDQGPYTYTVGYTEAGLRSVKVEYYENTGGAVAKLALSGCLGGTAQYFGNTTLSGTPVLTRCEDPWDDGRWGHDWGTGSPDPIVPSDGFSMRYRFTTSVGAGTYRFSATADDGVRVWVDGRLVIDAWKDQAPTTYTSAPITFAAKEISIKVEYYERAGGAGVWLAWGSTAEYCPPGQFLASYYNGKDPLASDRSLVLTRCESAPINHNWGTGSPGAGVNPDGFSAIYRGVFWLPAGTHRFIATSDDGVNLAVTDLSPAEGPKLWHDASLEAWYDQAATTHTVTTEYWPAGYYTVSLLYYENAGNSMVKLGWDGQQTSARSEVIVDDLSSGFTKGGSWWQASTAGYNGHSWWTYVYGNSVDCWGEWRAALGGGSYEVFVFVPSANSSTTSARYTVYYQGGSAVKTVNQSSYYNQWVSLGTYTFDAGTSSSLRVRLTDATGEAINSQRIAFDAVRFTPR